MTKLKIRPFEPEHFVRVVAREPDKSIMAGLDFMSFAKEYAKRGPCWTGYVEEIPIFCAGIVLLWPGMGEGWAHTSNLVPAHRYAFHRAIVRGIEQAASDYKLRRLQMSVPHDYTVSQNWIRHLGFTEESKMPLYGPDGALYIQYVRFFRVN